MSDHEKAQRVAYLKFRYPDSAILEYVVWKLPKPTIERPYGFKYRYYYGKGNNRLVGYDNEHGKGDHKHILGEEFPYTFISIEQLTLDFLHDVQTIRDNEVEK